MPAAALTRIAEADGFHAFGLSRRQAVWAIKGLPDTDLPLFAALEGNEPAAALRPMTAGREVVEDYSRTGLSLRRHPVAFLREDLTRRTGRPTMRRPSKACGLVTSWTRCRSM